MLKIGDFSKISQVSVKTLRFYDEMGLLKPVEERTSEICAMPAYGGTESQKPANMGVQIE